MDSVRKLLSKISVESIKMELMKTAYGNRDTYMARRDPRVLMIWYLVFGLLPWFTFNKTILFGLLLFVTIIAIFSKVSPLIITLLCLGIIGEIGYIAVIAFFFGGDLTAFMSLLTLTLKIVIMSVASIVVFASMDPEKFSDALLSFGVPGQFSFGVSYGYRMLPILIDEYQNIIHSYRLRGKTPVKQGFLKYRVIIYFVKISVKAFYPMILNTAKRTRTTVEALEVKGFTYSLENKEAKKIKLAYLKVRKDDWVFVAGSVCIVAIIMMAGQIYPA